MVYVKKFSASRVKVLKVIMVRSPLYSYVPSFIMMRIIIPHEGLYEISHNNFCGEFG